MAARIGIYVLGALICIPTLLYPATLGPSKPLKPQTFTGRVSMIDTEAGSLVVMSRGKSMTFNTSSAKMRGYETVRGIRTGDKIMVSYEMHNDRALARVITKRSSAASKKGPFSFLSLRRT